MEENRERHLNCEKMSTGANFGNFVHEERKKEEETLEICEDILKNSRNEMAVAMRFLQSAFGALRPTVSGETDVMGTDGKLLFARRHGF